jgi:hypothetical protein
MVFAIDSSNTVDLRATGAPSCKLWLSTPQMLAATTGLLDTHQGWNSVSRGRSRLDALSPDAAPQQIDAAMVGWSSDLIDYLHSIPGPLPLREGIVASLLVSFVSNGHLFLYVQTVAYRGGELSKVSSVRQTLVDGGDVPYVNGSCRDFFRNDGPSIRADILSPEAVEIDQLMTVSSRPAVSSHDLLQAASRLEELLARVSDDQGPGMPHFIGPPYQTAEYSSGSGHWITHFQDPCVSLPIDKVAGDKGDSVTTMSRPR